MHTYKFKITVKECVDRVTELEVSGQTMSEAYQSVEQQVISNFNDLDWKVKDGTVSISDFDIDFVEKNNDHQSGNIGGNIQ